MNIKNFALTGLLFSSVVIANAQQKLSDGIGDNGLTVNQNAILELASKNKGLLHTRVTLETTTKAYPMSAHVAGLMVYNTETRNDVVPGIYYNDGTKWVLASGGKATSISYNPTTFEISFVDANGSPVTIDFKEVVKKNETITTLVSIGEGKYEYTSENNTKTVINVPADVIQNFETIVKQDNVKNEIINLIKNVGGNVYYDGDKFTYVTTTGEVKEITVKEIVAANETLTVLSYNQTTNALTYKDEKGKEEIINLNIGTIVYDSKTNTITYVDGNGGATPLTLNETSLVYDQTTKVLTYTDSKGVSHEIDLGALVAAHETVTTITEDKGIYTYINEKNEKFEINVPKSVVNNFETIVKDGPVTVNGDTFSTIEEYITHLANNVSNVSGSDFITVTGTGTATDPYKVSIKEGAANSMLITNDKGELEWATIESIVKGNETVTTITEDKGIYTYINEKNEKFEINVPKSVVNNFETIVKDGPVTVNGDTFSTIEEYITHLANNVSNVSGSDFITVTGTGTATDPYKVSIKEGAANSMLITNDKGELEWATIESIVKGNETVTTITEDKGIYTYINEKNEKFEINVPKSVVNNFETIVKDGPVTVNGDTFSTIEEYITHLANNVSNVSGSDFITVTGTGTATDPYKVSIKEGAANSMLITNDKGELEWATIESIVKNNETLTVLSYDATKNVLTYVDEEKQTKTITLNVGSVAYDKDANTITYIDAAGMPTVLTLNETSLTYESTTQELVYVNSKGETETINLGNLVASNTTNSLTLEGNKLTSTVNDKAASVTLTDANLTSTKGITSSNITVSGGSGATLKDVTLEVTAGTNGQVMVTKEGKTAWVDQSTIVPMTTNELKLTGNNLVSTVNGVASTPAVDLAKYLDNTDQQKLKDFKVIGTDLSITIEGGNTVTVPLADIATLVDTDKQQISSFILAGNKLKIVLERGGEKEVDLSTLQVTYLENGINTTVTGDGTAANKYKVNVTVATAARVGVVKPGTGLTIDEAGTLSVVPVTTAGKSLTGDGIIGVANGEQSVLAATQLKINDGTITSEKITDRTIQGIDLNGNVAGEGLVINTGTNSIDVQAKNGVKVDGDFVKLGGPLTEATTITNSGNTLTIATGGTATTISGLPDVIATQYNANNGVGSDRLVVADATSGLLKEMKAAMPKFFYAPSIALPTASDQVVANSGITVSNGVYTVQLYTIYSNQFGGTFATGTSNSGKVANNTRTTVLPTLPANELDYYITFFDTTVFSDVTISDTGVMTYKVKSDADVTVGSFMNIVFAVKP